MIIELIKELPSEQAVLKLIAKFDKLLHKYANQVRIEDSYEELRLFFVELIIRIKDRGICSENDGQVVNYIRQYRIMQKWSKCDILFLWISK